MTQKMITVDHLYKRFGALNAVSDLSFQVAPGEILGFLGPNGAGKSTTMKMLTGYLAPTSGNISVLGHDIATDAQGAQRRVGYLAEGAPCYDEMTPRTFLRFIADVRELGDRADERIAAVVETLSLQAVLDQRIETLSKGFRRRVGLAQAILHDPEVLILDEPTDGLDPNQKHQVREMIQGLSKDKIVIISTHILEEVTAVCTRAIIIAGGTLVADCTPAELAARSRYHGAIVMEFADENAATAAGTAFAGKVAGEQEVEGNVVTLFPTGDNAVADVISAASELDAKPQTLYQEQGRLDEVFRDVTGGQD